jgi:hypothetical protein
VLKKKPKRACAKKMAEHGPPETIKAGKTSLEKSHLPMRHCAAGVFALTSIPLKPAGKSLTPKGSPAGFQRKPAM